MINWIRRLLSKRESNLEIHAIAELSSALGNDEMDSEMRKCVMRLIREFSRQGHSGMSAAMCIDLFQKVARFQPIGPLTGQPSEWGEPFCEEGTRQNRRCSHVFLRPDGTAYDIYAKVFRDPDGCCFTSIDSRAEVTFPYVPKTVYVAVEANR